MFKIEVNWKILSSEKIASIQQTFQSNNCHNISKCFLFLIFTILCDKNGVGRWMGDIVSKIIEITWLYLSQVDYYVSWSISIWYSKNLLKSTIKCKIAICNSALEWRTTELPTKCLVQDSTKDWDNSSYYFYCSIFITVSECCVYLLTIKFLDALTWVRSVSISGMEKKECYIVFKNFRN